MDVSSLRLPLIAAILLVIPCLIQRILPRINTLIAILMCSWCVFAFIAFLINDCTNVAQDDAMYNLAVLMYIVLLSARMLDTREKIFWFMFVVAFSIAFHSGKGGLNALISGNLTQYDVENLRGMFSGSNAYALLSGMLLFFMIFATQYLGNSEMYDKFPQLMKRPSIQKGLKYLMLILTLGTIYNVISLSSRGASLAMFLGLFVWILLQTNRAKIMGVLIPLIIIGLIVVPLPEGYTDRFASIFADADDRDNSAASRPHFWNTARLMANAHPLGVGPGCYAAYYDEFDPTDGLYGNRRSVHSSHFQILADVGYIGVFLWVLLFFISYLRLRKIRKLALFELTENADAKFNFDLANALIAAQTVFLIGGAFYEMAYNDIIWLTWGMTIALSNLTKREREAKENTLIADH